MYKPERMFISGKRTVILILLKLCTLVYKMEFYNKNIYNFIIKL